ncbi:hypothetical protein COLO4_03750 [Corchorus olitorius]|uniref:Uncharacterized protein n=1 Tax=Corchorus olitorius TaxID=93759 RepID=A0A1R3KWY8_9ROSI|nr:hypothetical protein COLO4_03750 [Corchorus olitorius]
MGFHDSHPSFIEESFTKRLRKEEGEKERWKELELTGILF